VGSWRPMASTTIGANGTRRIPAVDLGRFL